LALKENRKAAQRKQAIAQKELEAQRLAEQIGLGVQAQIDAMQKKDRDALIADARRKAQLLADANAEQEMSSSAHSKKGVETTACQTGATSSRGKARPTKALKRKHGDQDPDVSAPAGNGKETAVDTGDEGDADNVGDDDGNGEDDGAGENADQEKEIGQTGAGKQEKTRKVWKNPTRTLRPWTAYSILTDVNPPSLAAMAGDVQTQVATGTKQVLFIRILRHS
jgi:hypothetical protein